MNPEPASLEETPTWAVSIICLVFFVVSASIDAGLHRLTKFLEKRKRKALNRALGRIKIEMMILGFLSLLLTISGAPISKICVPQAMANSFLPCKDPPALVEPVDSSATEVSGSTSNTTTAPTQETTDDDSYCEAKGKVSLVSREGIRQLNIFISVLAVFHVLYSVLTMCLGIAKMRKWKAWEEETQTLEYKIANDPNRFRFTRQTSFGRRHLKFWSDYPLLLWPVCLVRQFSGPVSKADYFTLRNGFIMAHLAQEGSNFNFQKFLSRTFDNDFAQVVGFSFWIWIYSILFIFFSAHGFYNYYWLPFIPLLIILAVGTKLGVVITRMCLASSNENDVTRGTFLVKPHDDLFWFGRPKWLLHFLQFVLFQNSFQLAFFAWTWYEYGLRSCFNRETEDIAIRIAMGVVVQFLCGYVTLPLYALVTQMGSQMKREVFTERVAKGLKHWHSTARQNLSRDRSTSTRHSLRTSFSDIQDQYDHLPSSAAMSSPVSPEISEETVQHDIPPHPGKTVFSTEPEITEEEVQPKIITRGSYDGEISFASTWKVQEMSKSTIGDTITMLEESDPDLATDFDH